VNKGGRGIEDSPIKGKKSSLQVLSVIPRQTRAKGDWPWQGGELLQKENRGTPLANLEKEREPKYNLNCPVRTTGVKRRSGVETGFGVSPSCPQRITERTEGKGEEKELSKSESALGQSEGGKV